FLDLDHFPESHTSLSIKNILISPTHNKLKISEKNKPFHFTTDFATNMKKACKDFYRLPCLARRLYTVVEDSIKLSRSKNADIEYFFKSLQSILLLLSFKTNIQKLLPMKIMTGPSIT
ncbi:MAG: hypothetical protein MHPSP_003835, partial [Paramarteilia canceri]